MLPWPRPRDDGGGVTCVSVAIAVSLLLAPFYSVLVSFIEMVDKKEVDLKLVKPTARKRVALALESAQRAKKTAQYTNAASILHTENPGLLQSETDLEQTLKVRQEDLLPHLDLSTTAKASFRLDLEQSGLSPYTKAIFSRSSRSLLVSSRRGHVSVTEWRKAKLSTELHLNETVRSATFLHNDAFFATAQKQYAYIYDSSGAQVHVLRKHRNPGRMVFLPYHLLLATASHPTAPESDLKYTDTSTGEIISDIPFGNRQFRLGACADLDYNPSSGIVHMGHSSGVVSLWSPVSDRPLARILTNAGGVRQVAVANSGLWMVTTGGDSTVKIWDMRTYKLLSSWRAPAMTTALACSQRDLIAYSFGATVQIWAPGGETGKSRGKKSDWGSKPYMMETYSGCRISGLDFCAFEDVLAVCHEQGVRTMIVPGAGEATFDTNAPNPYETRNQRRENEVRNLLDKLPPASIVLDSAFVGSVEQDPNQRQKEIHDRERRANLQKIRRKKEKKKMKGRNKISKRLKKKQDNIIDENKLELEEILEERRKMKAAVEKKKEREKAAVAAGTEAGPMEDELPDALRRFSSKV